jgi:hypothetical protein
VEHIPVEIGQSFVPFSFRSVDHAKMATARFDTTSAFSRYRADALLRCQACKLEVRLTPAHIRQMFPMPITLAEARRRLVCGGCGARGPKIAPAPQLSR